MIGVFDSGLGGLTVVKQIKKILPDQGVIYLGDTARVPYGTRSPETIREFAEDDTLFFKDKNIDLLVVACNTVSALALDVVKSTTDLKVIDVISPIEEKIKGLKNVALVATRATVNSNAYKSVSTRRHASLFVPLVEEGIINGKELDIFITKYFYDLKSADNIVLGCTHYPIIKNQIRKYLGKKINLIDPSVEVALEVKKFLNSKKVKSKNKTKKENDLFYLTDVNQRFLDTAKMFLGRDISKLIKSTKL